MRTRTGVVWTAISIRRNSFPILSLPPAGNADHHEQSCRFPKRNSEFKTFYQDLRRVVQVWEGWQLTEKLLLSIPLS